MFCDWVVSMECVSAFFAAGGIPIVLAAMDDHDGAGAVEQGCRLLRLLVNGCGTAAAASVVRNDGVLSLAAALEDHISAPSAAAEVCQALTAVASSPAYKAAVVAAGALVSATEASKAHPGDASVVSAAAGLMRHCARDATYAS